MKKNDFNTTLSRDLENIVYTSFANKTYDEYNSDGVIGLIVYLLIGFPLPYCGFSFFWLLFAIILIQILIWQRKIQKDPGNGEGHRRLFKHSRFLLLSLIVLIIPFSLFTIGSFFMFIYDLKSNVCCLFLGLLTLVISTLLIANVIRLIKLRKILRRRETQNANK